MAVEDIDSLISIGMLGTLIIFAWKNRYDMGKIEQKVSTLWDVVIKK